MWWGNLPPGYNRVVLICNCLCFSTLHAPIFFDTSGTYISTMIACEAWKEHLHPYHESHSPRQYVQVNLRKKYFDYCQLTQNIANYFRQICIDNMSTAHKFVSLKQIQSVKTIWCTQYGLNMKNLIKIVSHILG